MGCALTTLTTVNLPGISRAVRVVEFQRAPGPWPEDHPPRRRDRGRGSLARARR